LKPKTFTYNQIITFFLDNKLPLTQPQVHLIASKVKVEIAALAAYKAKRQAKKDKRFLDKEHKAKLGYSRVGADNV
jgi:hypothetical protein